MRECERCGTVVPVIEMHTASDGGDVCPECCDICNKPSEETMATIDHILGASIHLNARTITVRARQSGATYVNLEVGTSDVCISGTPAEVRAVAEAIAAAVDRFEVG